MAREILDLSPFPGARFVDVWDGIDESQDEGPAEARDLVASGLARRIYTWPTEAYPEVAADLNAFLAAQRLAGTAFYIRDPWSSFRYDVEVGPATSGQRVFYLPDDPADEASRGYPESGTLEVTVAGAARAVSHVSTDGRGFVLATAATSGQSVLATYRELRLVRFGPGVDWTGAAGDWYAAQIELREIMRDPATRHAAPAAFYPGSPFAWSAGVAIAAAAPLSYAGPARTWRKVAGTLPAGVSLAATTGTLTGTPASAATGSATIRAAGPGGTVDVEIAWVVT